MNNKKAARPVPAIGELYYLQLTDKLLLPICCAEHVDNPDFGYCELVYTFKPIVAGNPEVGNLYKADMIIDPMIILPQYFTSGALRKLKTTSRVMLPFYSRHIFYNEYFDFYESINGEKLNRALDESDPKVCVLLPEISVISSVCNKASKALSIEVDYESISDRLDAIALQSQEVSEKSRNKRSVDMSIEIQNFPQDSPDELWHELESCITEQIEGKQLGEWTGHGSGLFDGIVDISYTIMPGKYPQAVKLVRKLVEEFGIKEYSIRGWISD